MKRLAVILLLILCGCSAQTHVRTDISGGAVVHYLSSGPTPELLIAPQQPTRAPVPTATMRTYTYIPVATATQEIHRPQNLVPPTQQTCRIKGNVSTRNKEQKIYHCPGWPDYAETTVITSEGDRWFCSEAEAIAAGFRRPKNVSSPCRP